MYYFNSIWYDYKVDHLPLVAYQQYFNSIWYDYKYSHEQVVYREFQISIPYGTIISPKKTTSNPFRIISIPYGTIISPNKLKRQIRTYYFNSIWYDYKFHIKTKFVFVLYFNSIWYDYKATDAEFIAP